MKLKPIVNTPTSPTQHYRRYALLSTRGTLVTFIDADCCPRWLYTKKAQAKADAKTLKADGDPCEVVTVSIRVEKDK